MERLQESQLWMTMYLTLLANAEENSGVNSALKNLPRIGIGGWFSTRDYGPGIKAISIYPICREPDLKRRQPSDLSDPVLYINVMLHLPDFLDTDDETRLKILSEALYNEVPRIALNYKKKVKDFDLDQFIADYRQWFIDNGRAPDT